MCQSIVSPSKIVHQCLVHLLLHGTASVCLHVTVMVTEDNGKLIHDR